ASLRFRNRCSLSELGRHCTVANASRSASGYRCLLLDSVQRGFPLYPMGSAGQRSLSGSLIRFLKSRHKGSLRETGSSISTGKHHSSPNGGRLSRCGSYCVGDRLRTILGRPSTSVRHFSNDSCPHRARSDPSRHPPGGGKNQTSSQGLLDGYYSRSRSCSCSCEDSGDHCRCHRSRDPRLEHISSRIPLASAHTIRSSYTGSLQRGSFGCGNSRST